MVLTTENNLEQRIARVDAAVALREGDRVPMAPKIGMAYAQTAGIDRYEALNDARLLRPGVEKFLQTYPCDLFWAGSGYPIPMMETLGTTAIRWPGATCGVPLNQGFQIVDGTYMEEDEYDEFLRDPSHFCMTKVFPRKHKKLAGLAKLNFHEVVEFGHYASMAAFADPEVRQALLTLMFAGEQAVEWQRNSAFLRETALACQTPLGALAGQNAPYDMLADNIRGFLNVPMDLYEIPEKVTAAIDIMTEYALQNVRRLKNTGSKYCFMPLHGGTDDFMSLEDYRTFYWPSLRRVMEEIIDCGMIPYVFCEGKYDTRLEVLREVPRGKVIYMFEQVDIARAKAVLGDTACICGNLPTSLLLYGKPHEVVDETRRLLDTCAPGGGFLMDCSIVLDHYKEENLEAWFDTTLQYGRY
ncbi:uroporphyrinogen decarboxylase family protein [Pseudoflavonifractor gallinarum]|uniref:uroporphyrinogen decarboxylase family protein n=1 Tax=Pseudoflavonifractor gallinarum TaxID=2779352 RepID=UPI0036F42530